MRSGKRTPLYKQIQDYLIGQIRQNRWGPNYKLPSESEIAELFAVSRLTVKNALKDFVEQGMIYRIQGKGSFLAPNFNGETPVRPTINRGSKKLVACLKPVAFTTRTFNLVNGIEEELARQGYRMLFCKTHNSRDIEKQVIEEVLALDVAGIVIYPVEGQSYSEELLRLTLNHFPLVVIDRYLRGLETNCVAANNFQGTLDAVNHLIQLGHSQIGFISTPHKGISSIEDRLAGYEYALAQHHLPIEHRLRQVHLVMGKVNNILQNGRCDEEIKKGIQQFLRENSDMTAIFAINAGIGLSVMQAAEEMGLRIPEDLSVIFFDDYELSEFSRIPPSCVNQQEGLIGREAAKLIVSLIENPRQERRKIEIPTQLVVRESTGAPRLKAFENC